MVLTASMGRSCGSLFGSHYNAVNTRYCGSKLGANWQYITAIARSTSVCGNNLFLISFIKIINNLNFVWPTLSFINNPIYTY